MFPYCVYCSKTIGKEDAALLSQQTQEKDEHEEPINSKESYGTFVSVVERFIQKNSLSTEEYEQDKYAISACIFSYLVGENIALPFFPPVNDDRATKIKGLVDGPPSVTGVNSMDLCQPVNEPISTMTPVDDTPKSEADIQRKYWSEKRQKRQEEFAVKAMKQRGTAVTNLGLGPGAVLTLKVDYRTHSHASGLTAIVYKSNTTGGALICCEHGVITHNGEKKDYWVPSDKYLIVAGKDEVCNIPPGIAKIRAIVQAGEYDPKKQVRISYAKYHEITIGASSPCKRNICSCKRGCTKSCGCRRKNLKCTSSCGCSGTCMPEDL